jgi:hypothetical protein
MVGQFVHAQVSAGVGLQVDFPLLYNKNVGSYNHSLGAIGPQLSLKYIPQYTVFYPALSIHMTAVTLPLIKTGDIVVNMRFFMANAVISANHQKVYDNKRELHYGLGIGVSYMNGVSVETRGTGNNMTSTSFVSVTEDSTYITTWLPSVQAGIEYVFPVSSKKPLFAGIGGKIQYSYVFDNQKKYHVTIVDNKYQVYQLEPNLYGHLVTPGIYLALYYKFGRKDY